MSDPTNDAPSAAETPEAPATPRRKAGFFSRLFETKNIEEAEETLRALEQADLEPAAAGEPEEKRGISRWWGRRKDTEGEALPKVTWFQRLRDRLGRLGFGARDVLGSAS